MKYPQVQGRRLRCTGRTPNDDNEAIADISRCQGVFGWAPDDSCCNNYGYKDKEKRIVHKENKKQRREMRYF